MATLHVRNVPNEIYDRLKERAAERNRSLSAEVITLLDFALSEVEDDQAALLDSIRRRRFFRPATVAAPDSVALLREDRGR